MSESTGGTRANCFKPDPLLMTASRTYACGRRRHQAKEAFIAASMNWCLSISAVKRLILIRLSLVRMGACEAMFGPTRGSTRSRLDVWMN